MVNTPTTWWYPGSSWKLWVLYISFVKEKALTAILMKLFCKYLHQRVILLPRAAPKPPSPPLGRPILYTSLPASPPIAQYPTTSIKLLKKQPYYSKLTHCIVTTVLSDFPVIIIIFICIYLVLMIGEVLPGTHDRRGAPSAGSKAVPSPAGFVGFPLGLEFASQFTIQNQIWNSIQFLNFKIWRCLKICSHHLRAASLFFFSCSCKITEGVIKVFPSHENRRKNNFTHREMFTKKTWAKIVFTSLWRSVLWVGRRRGWRRWGGGGGREGGSRPLSEPQGKLSPAKVLWSYQYLLQKDCGQ